jgi:hypothetical protein
MVAVIGAQVQKHRTRLGGGAVEICVMSGKPVSALKLQPVLSSRAKRAKPAKKSKRSTLN